MDTLSLALVSYFAWGGGDLFGAIASRRAGGTVATFWILLASALIFAPCLPFAAGALAELSWSTLILALVLGLVVLIADVTFNEALATANPSLVATVSGSFGALTVVLSAIFLGERLSGMEYGAIAVITAGVGLCTLKGGDLLRGRLGLGTGIGCALVAMLCWAVYSTFVKFVVKDIGWFWPNYISFLLCPLLYFYIRARRLKFVVPRASRLWIPIALSAALMRLGDFSFNNAISYGLTSIAAPVAAAFPTFLAVLGFFVFRDPISRQQVAGIVIALAGIIFLGTLA